MTARWQDGCWRGARQVRSRHCDARPDRNDISLLVLHNISLPPGQFGTPYVEAFFTGQLPVSADPYFSTIADLRVSAHFFIRRDGEIVQFVSTHDRAWHAGVSSFQGRERCNDFSIGIEIEGSDDCAYLDAQYAQLVALTLAIVAEYPAITLERITGHQHVAPQRKTDPGSFFDWDRYRRMLSTSWTR